VKFEPGNKLAKGGKRKGAGRPPKAAEQIEQRAADIAREFIESNVKPVLNNYFRLANGWLETRYSENGTEYDTFCYDGPTTRHFIDKVLPDEQIQPQAPVINVLIAAGVSGNQSQPDVRANGIQISLGGVNGRNGNGGDGS
jgi:hypothetical protein